MAKLNVSKAPSHVQYLDGLRGIAILMVLAVHTYDHTSLQFAEPFFPSTPTWLRSGAYGVQLFFILSAFTLLRSSDARTQERFPTASFYLRRAFRILPLWWLAVFAYGLLNRNGFSYLLPNLFFYSGFIRFRPIEMILPQWSLFVEETFYLFLPLLLPLRLSVKRAGIFLIALLVVQQLWSGLAPTSGVPANYFFIDYFPLNQWFCFGIGFVWFALVRGQYFFTLVKKKQIPSSLLDALTLVFLVVLIPLNHVAAAFAFVPLVFTASVSQTLWGRFCRSRLLTAFGRSCYSIYLWQIAIFNLFAPFHTSISQSLGLAQLSLELQFLIAFPVFAAYSLAVGMLSWRFIERPLIEFGRRIIAKLNNSPNLFFGPSAATVER